MSIGAFGAHNRTHLRTSGVKIGRIDLDGLSSNKGANENGETYTGRTEGTTGEGAQGLQAHGGVPYRQSKGRLTALYESYNASLEEGERKNKIADYVSSQTPQKIGKDALGVRILHQK